MNAPAEHYRAELEIGELPQGVTALTALLLKRYGASLLAVLLYGSCRRRGDASEGLVDLLVLVTGYRAAHGRLSTALTNRLLPPNVYYLETDYGGDRYRCKYAVVSLAQFQRRCAHGLDAYFRARFFQPAALAWASNLAVIDAIARARADAARVFAASAAGLVPPGRYATTDFWTRSLELSYRCELRPEPPAAAASLVAADAGFWTRLAGALDGEVRGFACDSGAFVEIRTNFMQRLSARAGWFLRACWGKTLNLARLIKAAGTFSGGLDYLLWKVERHSGVRIEATPRMRRHPRLAAWGLAWRLWRRGGFR